MSSAVNCDLCLYADDSMLLVNGRNVNDIEKKLTKEKDKYEAAILKALRKLEVSSDTVARFEND